MSVSSTAWKCHLKLTQMGTNACVPMVCRPTMISARVCISDVIKQDTNTFEFSFQMGKKSYTTKTDLRQFCSFFQCRCTNCWVFISTVKGVSNSAIMNAIYLSQLMGCMGFSDIAIDLIAPSAHLH